MALSTKKVQQIFFRFDGRQTVLLISLWLLLSFHRRFQLIWLADHFGRRRRLAHRSAAFLQHPFRAGQLFGQRVDSIEKVFLIQCGQMYDRRLSVDIELLDNRCGQQLFEAKCVQFVVETGLDLVLVSIGQFQVQFCVDKLDDIGFDLVQQPLQLSRIEIDQLGHVHSCDQAVRVLENSGHNLFRTLCKGECDAFDDHLMREWIAMETHGTAHTDEAEPRVEHAQMKVDQTAGKGADQVRQLLAKEGQQLVRISTGRIDRCVLAQRLVELFTPGIAQALDGFLCVAE